MIWKFSNKRKSQSLIELVLSIALAIFFLTAFIVNLAFITTKFSDYKDKYYAYQLVKEQKKLNDRNLAYLLANNKIVSNYTTNGYFAVQGSHLNYTYLNYESTGLTSFLNQEKKYFLNDDYIYYWSLDAIPSSSTYIVDDKGDNARKGTLSCLGLSCTNPIIVDKSKGHCVSNNCLKFETAIGTAGTITFPSMNTLNNSARSKTTWEAWVNSFSPSDDAIFMSRGDYNYFGIIDNFPTVQFKLGTEEKLLSAPVPISPLQWYHLVATYDGSYISIYVNGVLSAKSENVSGMMGYNDILKFGYFTESNPTGFLGHLDEIKIYGRALSDAEILNRYNAFRKNIGLVANWHLDDALNTATYSGASEAGLNPKFTSFSSPDNIPIIIEKAKAENNPTLCKSGACTLFYRNYSSKGTLIDSSNTYTQLHSLSNITLSANIKITNINTGYQGIFGKDVNGNYALGLSNDDIQIDLKIEGTRYSKTYEANLEANRWYQIDATFDGSDIKLYVDGVFKGMWNQPGGITDDTNHGNIYIGYSGTDNEYFDGYIDEIKIYNRALSSEEINNPYDGGFTHYQYYKPVCRTSQNGTISAECLNCNPINGTECVRAESGVNFESLLVKSIYIVKFGKGINYKQHKSEQIIPVVNSFYQQEAGANVWAGGYTPYSGTACGRFVFGTYGDSAGSTIRYNSACGNSACGREIVGSQVCQSSNFSYFYDNGCTTCSGTPGSSSWTCDVCEAEGYFEKTSSGDAASMISPTFNFPKKMGLTSFGWIGSGGPVKFQFACLDDIVDGSGSELPEGAWSYLGPEPSNSKRCTASDYYSANPNTSYPVSSCWETDNQSLHNCQFFRFKIVIDAPVQATINSVRLNFGQYPYTIIK